MKKTIMLALVVLASANFCPSFAGPKKDKKKKKDNATVVAEPVKLLSTSDSLSYAMGMEATNGLIPYLVNQVGVDTAYMDKFIEGFNTYIDKERNNKETTAYAAGIQIAKMVNTQMIKQAQKHMEGSTDSVGVEMFCNGFLASLNKDYSNFNDSTAMKYVTDTREAVLKKLTKEGEEFLAQNAMKEGVKTTPSGLQYKVLREGNGPVATTKDEVEVKYEGRLINGTVFDSSYKRNPQTTKFRPTQVIKGWTEALTMMKEGSMWELYIPYNLAYGERATGTIPAYSTLIFQVELEKVIKAEEKQTKAEEKK